VAHTILRIIEEVFFIDFPVILVIAHANRIPIDMLFFPKDM